MIALLLSTDTRDRVASLTNELPFNRWLGVRVVALELGMARLRVAGRAELIGDPHRYALHGGVISALLDTCAGAAAWTMVGLDEGVATVDLLVDYLRPGRPCDLVAEARVLREGRLSVVSARAFHPDTPDESVAEARGVYRTRRYKAAK